MVQISLVIIDVIGICHNYSDTVYMLYILDRCQGYRVYHRLVTLVHIIIKL